MPDGSIVVDFGSYSVNGNLRSVFEPKHKYIGIDQSAGPNVDVVCNNRETPFPDNYADAVISTSCFEHDECFWMTFLEMCRIVKPGGYIYINAPSQGPYHGYPGDSWRFYKDSWDSLRKWAKENKYNMLLVETYVDVQKSSNPRPEDLWLDSVGIYKKE